MPIKSTGSAPLPTDNQGYFGKCLEKYSFILEPPRDEPFKLFIRKSEGDTGVGW